MRRILNIQQTSSQTTESDPKPRPAGAIRLLDADPDLIAGLLPAEAALATSRSTVGTVAAPPGPWSLPSTGRDSAFYLLSGTVARRVQVAGRPSTELIGPGQLLRPEPEPVPDTVLDEVRWRVLTPSWLAVLDSGFWSGIAPFPSVVVSLLDRGLGRARSLSERLAMNGNPNLATRVRLLLWHIAESHGRVTSDGVLLNLPLSHETVADLVSASRPSVSAALKKLEHDGHVSRSRGGGYLLLGPAPVSPVAAAYGKASAASTVLEVATNIGSAGLPI